MQLHPRQRQIASSPARFKVVRAGRKGGKTALEVETISYKAVAKVEDLGIKKEIFDTGRKVIYIAPTQLQARNIIWEALKNRLAVVGKPNEQLLQMKVQNADGLMSTIYVGGWENRENYRGLTDVVHISFDETDTLKDFSISWKEIFRPMFLDTGGTADFIGTPNNKNPNLKRLAKDFEELGEDFASFHFTSKDNPFLPLSELDAIEREYQNDRNSYQQEILAEYVENEGALFKYAAILDIFSNAVPKTNEKYLTVDVADDGSDKTIFTFWNGLESTKIDLYDRLHTDGIISQIREDAAKDRIPYSNIAVDAIGVGAGVATSPLLEGIVGYKGSYSPIKTDIDIVRLPNVHYRKEAPLTSEYKNLRSQCIFTLAGIVNERRMAIRSQDERVRSKIVEELSIYQDASTGDGKRAATQKERMKELLGRSTDITDTLVMRMYFEVRGRMMPGQSLERKNLIDRQDAIFSRNRRNSNVNSNK